MFVELTIEFIFLYEQEFYLVFYEGDLCFFFLDVGCVAGDVFWNFNLA